MSRTAAAQNLLHYIGDPKHPDHRHKIIKPEVVVGVPSGNTPLEMLLLHGSKCHLRNKQIRRGRKIKRVFQQSIFRLGGGLDDDDILWLQTSIIKEMEWDFAISRAHADMFNGEVDAHIISPYRRGDGNPIAKLRAVCDTLHETLNQRRRERGAPRIETMVEVRSRKRKKAGNRSMAEQLSTVEDLSMDNLRSHIEGLGHTVTRFNPERGTVSVIHQGKKKAHRYSAEKLIAEAAALRTLKALPLPSVDLAGPSVSGP